MERIYLDHAAQTFVRPEILQGLSSLFPLGNPSSLHYEGRRARSIIDTARQETASFFSVSPEQVIFTSGATEGLHLAVIGAYLALSCPKKRILVSSLAHHSLLSAINFLKNNFGVEISFFPLDRNGRWDSSSLFFESFDLIVGERVNTELGVFQPTEKIFEKLSLLPSSDRPLFILDGSGSLAGEDKNFSDFGADIFVFSGEKIGAFSGVGGVLFRKGISLSPLFSGSQEFGIRGGTENVLGIYSLGKALSFLSAEKKDRKFHFQNLSEFVFRNIEQKKYPIKRIVPFEFSCDWIFSFLLSFHKGHDFVIFADLHGISLSAGNACSSGARESSLVLQSLGFSLEDSQRLVRISFSLATQKKDLEKFFQVLELFSRQNRQ